MDKRERYARCKAEGRCPNCFNKHNGKYLYCDRCLEWRDKRYTERKPCKKCGVELPFRHRGQYCVECQSKRRDKDGWREWFYKLSPEKQAEIREYQNEYTTKWRIENPEKHQDTQLARRYGISFAIARKLYDDQLGKCAICGNDLPMIGDKTAKRKDKPHVDHDHNSGIVRGLLCLKCNHLLGNCRDNVTILRNAIAYLDRHQD